MGAPADRLLEVGGLSEPAVVALLAGGLELAEWLKSNLRSSTVFEVVGDCPEQLKEGCAELRAATACRQTSKSQAEMRGCGMLT